MKKEEFIRRWRTYTAGVIALGMPQARKLLSGGYNTAEQVGDALTHINDSTRELLGKLFDSLAADQPEPDHPAPSKPAATPANGQPKR